MAKFHDFTSTTPVVSCVNMLDILFSVVRVQTTLLNTFNYDQKSIEQKLVKFPNVLARMNFSGLHRKLKKEAEKEAKIWNQNRWSQQKSKENRISKYCHDTINKENIFSSVTNKHYHSKL